MSVSNETLLAEIKELRKEIAALSAAAIKTTPIAATKTKAPRAPKVVDPDAPKKDANNWVKSTDHIRTILKERVVADNAAIAEGGKKIVGHMPASVGSMLKASGKLQCTPELVLPSDEDIFAAYEQFKTNPPEPKGPAIRAAAAAKKAESVASAGDAKAAPVADAKPKRVLTDEHKAKMQAARVAKKAEATATAAVATATAAVAPTPKPKMKVVAKPVVTKVFDLSFAPWVFDDNDYITNERGDTLDLEFNWVGRFNGKSIDKSIPRPSDIDDQFDMDE